MKNPLYEAYGRNSGMPNMMQAFNQFKQTVNGNPEAIVKGLLQSGRMTQAQFNQLQQMANQFRGMMGK